MKCDPSNGYIPLAQSISVVYNACRHVSDTRTNAVGIFFWRGGWGGGCWFHIDIIEDCRGLHLVRWFGLLREWVYRGVVVGMGCDCYGL
nr:hypothetical protein CFP56_19919 [Quercus suber]